MENENVTPNISENENSNLNSNTNVNTPPYTSQVPENKGLSIASMVLGIVGIFAFALPCGILAIIFSVLGKKKGGSGFATTGLVLGILDVVFPVLLILLSL